MRNPPHDMTSVGPQCRHRISLQPTQDFSPQNLGFLFSHSWWPPLANILHNARWTAADNWEIRKCKFSAISPPSSEIWASSHIWRLTQSVRVCRSYLSLSVLKITMSWNNLIASVNQRSLHCLEVTRRYCWWWSPKRNDPESLSTWSLL